MNLQDSFTTIIRNIELIKILNKKNQELEEKNYDLLVGNEVSVQFAQQFFDEKAEIEKNSNDISNLHKQTEEATKELVQALQETNAGSFLVVVDNNYYNVYLGENGGLGFSMS